MRINIPNINDIMNLNQQCGSKSCLFVFPSLSPAKAQVYEKVSLQGIQQLVHRSYQTLALWKLLCDHQFSLIMSELPKVHVCTNTSPVGQLQMLIHHHCGLHPHAFLNVIPSCFDLVYSVSSPLFLERSLFTLPHFSVFVGVSRADERSKF